MRIRTWDITLHHHEENLSGGRFGTEQELERMWQMPPTVASVRQAVQLFAPGFVPDERWMTVKEQIADSLDSGFFDIQLRKTDGSEIDFESWSMGFMEV